MEGCAFAGRTKDSCDYTVAATSSYVSLNEVATSMTTSAMRYMYELSALADLNSVYIIHSHYALYVNCSMNLT